MVLGSNAIILHCTNRECCDVLPYADSYKPMQNVPTIITGATAVTTSATGLTHIAINIQ
jgi:hypothetical protein